jgi:acyl carrier protein
MRDEISGAVRRFIAENFLFRDDCADITSDSSLVDAAVFDSTGMLELVSFLEAHFGIEVKDEEILPRNLDSIAAITDYVAAKLEGREERLVA